ncbi:MAG: multidrug effflux MFS transporter [Burkholderiaceae bacterium]
MSATPSSTLIVLLLSLLLGLQPITTDLYLPVLPMLSDNFAVSMAQAQLTLTALLLAFGSSQLVWGPMSDRFGRRPILLWGLSAYVLAAIASSLAPSLNCLILWRTLQGAAMGAAVMSARAIVRDLYPPLEGAGVMSKAMSGLGLIACLSAPLGGMLSDAFGWQMTLLSLAVFSAITLAIVVRRFEESLQHKNPRALQPAVLLRTWRGIIGDRTFLAFSALGTASYAGLFTFLAASPFVFINLLGQSRSQFGWVLFTMPMAYIVGTFLCRRLLSRFGLRRTVAYGGAISLAAGSLLGLIALLDWVNGWTIMLPFYLYMVGHGIHQPCSQSGSVGPFPFAAGAASALNGCLMMGVAFLMGLWLASQTNPSSPSWLFGIWFWGVLTALVAWTLVQQAGSRHES